MMRPLTIGRWLSCLSTVAYFSSKVLFQTSNDPTWVWIIQTRRNHTQGSPKWRQKKKLSARRKHWNRINAKNAGFFLAQTKGRREREKERKRKGKKKGKGEREREIGSEALAKTEKIANTPAEKRTRDPSKRGWSSTIQPPRQATSQASLFQILSALPPLHNIGIIQCSQLTNPLRSVNTARSALCITHGLKEKLMG